jgi:hypothetical protein
LFPFLCSIDHHPDNILLISLPLSALRDPSFLLHSYW